VRFSGETDETKRFEYDVVRRTRPAIMDEREQSGRIMRDDFRSRGITGSPIRKYTAENHAARGRPDMPKRLILDLVVYEKSGSTIPYKERQGETKRGELLTWRSEEAQRRGIQLE